MMEEDGVKGQKSSTINVKGDGQQLQTETENCIGYFWLLSAILILC